MAADLTIACVHCFTLNRVARERVGQKAICGQCKTSLGVDHPVALDDDSFDRYLARNTLPIVVDFWAAWCGPCRAMAPVFEAAARARAGSVLFAKVDTEKARQTAARLRIQSIPTLVVFQERREIARQSGALPQAMLDRWLNETL